MGFMDDSLHLYIAILNCFSMHLNINDTMTRFSLTFPRHCALNAVSAILTEGASLKQIIKIRDLVNTFKN